MVRVQEPVSGSVHETGAVASQMPRPGGLPEGCWSSVYFRILTKLVLVAVKEGFRNRINELEK